MQAMRQSNLGKVARAAAVFGTLMVAGLIPKNANAIFTHSGVESASHPTPSGCKLERKEFRDKKGKRQVKIVTVCPEIKCETRFGGEMVECIYK